MDLFAKLPDDGIVSKKTSAVVSAGLMVKDKWYVVLHADPFNNTGYCHVIGEGGRCVTATMSDLIWTTDPSVMTSNRTIDKQVKSSTVKDNVQ